MAGTKIELRSRIPEVSTAARKGVSDAVRRATFNVEAHAKVRAPVDTGALRNSIQGQMTGELEGEVAVGVLYGIYVEFGTVKASAQPFLGPAVEDVRASFVADVAKAVE